jgi:hypothetical protein
MNPFLVSARPGATSDRRTSLTVEPYEISSRRKFLGQMIAGAVMLRGIGPIVRAAEGTATVPSPDLLAYYAQPGAMDAGGAQQELLNGMPSEVGELAAVVQGLILHPWWAPAYGQTLTDERLQEFHLRGVGEMLACLEARSPGGAVARPPAGRLVGMCRQFTVLTVAALRAHGIPARARCGFAGYFRPGKFEDHWVVECWDARESRWRLVDAQLDALQREKLHLDFDPLDVPRDRFLVAGAAWQKYRRGEVRPDQFGLISRNEFGLWFVAGNLVRDLAALNKREMLPWDVWGAMPGPDRSISAEDATAFDEVAAYGLDPDAHFVALQERYRRDPRFTVPPTVTNALRRREESVPSGRD